MVNQHRGEVELVINGKPYCLCLTLGALAEIEGIVTDNDRLSAEQVLSILQALLRGGGNPLRREDLLGSDLSPDMVATAIGAALTA